MADDKPQTTTEAPEVKQPDKVAPIVEEKKPEQAAPSTSAADHQTSDNVVNIPFDKINEIMAEKNAGNREVVKGATAKAEKSKPATDTRTGGEKAPVVSPQDKQETRRGRPPKTDRTNEATAPKKEKSTTEKNLTRKLKRQNLHRKRIRPYLGPPRSQRNPPSLWPLPVLAKQNRLSISS